MNTALILIAGPSQSGKSTLANYLQLEANQQFGGDVPLLRLSLADALRKVLCLFAPEFEGAIYCRDRAAKQVAVYGHTIREHLIGLNPYIEEFQPEYVQATAQEAIKNFFYHVEGPGLVVVDDVRRVRELKYLANLVRGRYLQVAERLVVVTTGPGTEDPIFEEEVYDWKVMPGCGVVIDVDARGLKDKGFAAAQQCARDILSVVFSQGA